MFFDDIYKNLDSMRQLLNTVPANPMTEKEKAAVSLIAMASVLQTISSVVSRLSRGQMEQLT